MRPNKYGFIILLIGTLFIFSMHSFHNLKAGWFIRKASNLISEDIEKIDEYNSYDFDTSSFIQHYNDTKLKDILTSFFSELRIIKINHPDVGGKNYFFIVHTINDDIIEIIIRYEISNHVPFATITYNNKYIGHFYCNKLVAQLSELKD